MFVVAPPTQNRLGADLVPTWCWLGADLVAPTKNRHRIDLSEQSLTLNVALKAFYCTKYPENFRNLFFLLSQNDFEKSAETHSK